jgi:hypothetical protein
MHETRWIALADPLGAFDEVHAVARLVAHRPHDDARVVLVALDHVLHPVEVGLEPFRILGQRLRP